MAGIASVGATGGRRASSNACAYSRRARRRAYEREADKLTARFEAQHGRTGIRVTSEAEVAEWTAGRPERAQFIADMQALAAKWFG